MKEKRKRIVHLRERKKLTFREIGALLGASPSAVYKQYAAAKSEERISPEFEGLSARALNVLRALGIKNREELRKSFPDFINPYSHNPYRHRNCGEKTCLELKNFLNKR